MLAVPPEGPEPLPEAALEIQVLGTVRLVGRPGDAAPISLTSMEILVLLAFQPGRRLSADEIRSELGQGRDRDLDPGTIRRYITDLRPILPGCLPSARTTRGFTLVGLSTDFARFESYSNQAARTTDPPGQARLWASALSLVRGVPFANTPDGSYSWAFENSNLAATISNRTLSTAIHLASLALDHHDFALAAWAASRGLTVWPTDDTLNRAALTAVAPGGRSRLDQAWNDVSGRFAAQRESPPPSLYEHYRHLRTAD